MSLRPTVVGAEGPVVLPEGGGGSVCIVLLSGIGDVVHGLPLALDLKRRDPGTEVVWVAEPAPAAVLRHHPAVDRVVVYRTRDGIQGLAALRRDMADVSCTVTLNVQRYFKSVWPTMLSGAGTRVGLPPSKTRDGVRYVHTHVLEETPWKHTQDLFLDFRHPLGVARDAPVQWEITFSDEERTAQRTFFEAMPDRPVAALVVGSANPKKDWPAERQAAVADALARDFGMTVILLGGPSAREREVADRILATATTGPRDCLGDSVRRLMWLVDGADLVVAPDTGPLHIAHALDVPVVGLFAHTNPWRVGPYTRFHDLLIDRYTEAGAPPDPSGYLPRDDRMDAITVDDVLERVAVARTRYA
ncbi:MAG: glycosyltransferase family 9 protein [Longimicrobiales bacterium]